MRKVYSAIGVVFALLLILPPSGHAGSTTREVKSFTDMQKIVEGINDPSGTLVVMDDDDTLTMMSCPDQDKPETCQYLGGPAWYTWQASQVGKMAQPRVADTQDELLTASFMLFAINKMAYTSADIPVVLNKLAASAVRLMVETARGTDTVSATERQFASLVTKNRQYPNLLSLLRNRAPVFGPEGIAGKAGPFLPCGDHSMAPITYQQGAMYVVGQDKGSILKCLLDEYNAQPGSSRVRHVVFIDDTEENVVAVHKAFEASSTYVVYSLFYTALQEHKDALTKGPMADTHQANAMKQWKAIKAALENNLQNPMLP